MGSATNADRHGIVATPDKEADTGIPILVLCFTFYCLTISQGLGWNFNNWLHCASTAWVGLAFLSKTKPSANPYILPDKN